MAAGWFRQLGLLLWKNWLFSLRSWKSTILQLMAPCIFLALATGLSYLPKRLEDIRDPPTEHFGYLPKCQGWNGKGCVSLQVIGMNLSVPGNATVPLSKDTESCIIELKQRFVHVSGLDDSDVKMALELDDRNSTLKQIFNTTNETQAAIIFTECNKDRSSPKLNYTIMYNTTRALKFAQLVFGSPNKPDGRIEIQRTVDQVFSGMVLNKTLDITVEAQTFPKIFQQPSRQSQQASIIPIFIYCAITFQFVMMLYNVVSEKDLKLRQGLKLIGLKDSVYWTAWAGTGVVIAFLSTCIIMATGYACQLKYFFNTDFLINFLLFFIYSSSMVPLAFFASVFISTIAVAVAMGMMIFVIGFMIIFLLGTPFLLTQLYVSVKPLVYALSILPPFHLSKAVADIGQASSATDANGLPQDPHYFGWHQLFKPHNVTVFGFNSSNNSPILQTYELPPTYESFLWLIAISLVYGILFWYLDNVLPGNHGIPRKLYFFLQPSYWFNTNWKQMRAGQRHGDAEEDPLLDQTSSYGTAVALQVQNLTKTFKGLCSKATVSAVNQLSFSVQQDQILSLLGHNGAGKSTTINMLTGLLSPDTGDATFYGVSIKNNLDVIRNMLGVCPQHDVLWNDLTAREHMQLFAAMKGIPKGSIDKEINSLLERVQLNNVAKHRVATYSGGMKRRLSVAMCFIGDPQIVFLDEPTTGMDPKIRRNIWNLILEMKVNRVTIMTTHSMEEADILGDTIAIMGNGQMKVMGTSVNLKNRFAGYVIELIVRVDGVQQMMDLVSTQLIGATLKSDPLEVEEGVLLPYSLSLDSREDIVPFFKILENEAHIRTILVDYSISQTTLEEVFMNITLNEVYKQDDQYRPLLRRSVSNVSRSSS